MISVLRRFCRQYFPLLLAEAATEGILFCVRVFRNFTKVTEKYLFQSLFFNKIVGLRPATLLKKRLQQPATLLKKRLQHRCFPANFAKFLRTPFLYKIFSGSFCQQFDFSGKMDKKTTFFTFYLLEIIGEIFFGKVSGLQIIRFPQVSSEFS